MLLRRRIDSMASSIRRHGRAVLVWGFMLAVLAVCLAVQEQYPFSHFPMYGNPNAKPVEYYFLTDGGGNPLPVLRLTGDTAPRIKKRIQTREDTWMKEHGVRRRADVPADVHDAIAKDVLAGFVTQARQRGRAMPERVKLWRALIHQLDDGYHETFEVEAEN